jgi:hypothetical protein
MKGIFVEIGKKMHDMYKLLGILLASASVLLHLLQDFYKFIFIGFETESFLVDTPAP